MRQFQKIWLALACLALAAPSVAADSAEIFQIELVVFARTDESIARQERWPLDPGVPNWANSAELFGPVDADASGTVVSEGQRIARLPASAFALTDAAIRLRQSREYRVLVHTAWRQSIPAQSSGTPVFIDDSGGPQSLPRITKEIQIVGVPQVSVVKPGQSTELDAVAPQPTEPRQFAEGPPNLTLFGTLAIRQTRFLHAVLDLLYRAPQIAKNEAKAEPNPIVPKTLTLNEARADGTSPIRAFRLTETRRLRSGETHYFDHPMFGALLRVTPVAVSDPNAPDATTKKPVKPAINVKKP